MLEEIYNKTNIDMTAFIKRLEIELSIVGIQDEEKENGKCTIDMFYL